MSFNSVSTLQGDSFQNKINKLRGRWRTKNGERHEGMRKKKKQFNQSEYTFAVARVLTDIIALFLYT